MDFDKDLQSIQEVRWLVAKAVVAQKELAKMSQQQVDGIAKAIADACAAQSERLAKMAVEETGFGIWQDKVLKNLLGSAITWDSVKDMKTVGIIKDDRQNGLMEVGVPMGVVATLIPSTNPQRCTSRLFQSKRAMPLSSVRIRMPRIVLLRLQRSFVKQPEKPVRRRVSCSASHCRPWKPQMHS